MSVTRIQRTDMQEFAIKLRELARSIDDGKIAYVTVFSVDQKGHVDEFVMTDGVHSHVQVA